MDILELIGRQKELFTEDVAKHEKELTDIASSSRFLVIGGAGSIFMWLISVKTTW